MVTDQIGDRLCAIQVKTRVEKRADGGWHMGRKHETIHSPSLFYIFLDFGRTLTDPPACFVVPGEEVAAAVRDSDALWLSLPGQKGQQRKDTDLRRFLPDYDRQGLVFGRGPGWLKPYREAWGLLENKT